MEGGDVAFYRPEDNIILTVSSACKNRDYNLETLSDSLALGIGEKRIRLRKNIEIDVSTGLYTEYETLIDGESFSLATVVYKSDKCSYDFSYFSPVG